jgi:hypothetical protein
MNLSLCRASEIQLVENYDTSASTVISVLLPSDTSNGLKHDLQNVR